MFSPTLGRWVQNDPIEYEADDPNLYRFVSNNPTNQVDPSGLVGVPYPLTVVPHLLTGNLFRFEHGEGDPPSLGDPPFKPAPYNYLGVLYGVESNGFRSAGVGYFRLKSTGNEASKATFKNQSVTLGIVGGCKTSLTFDAEVTIRFGRLFAEKPLGSGKFPFGAGGGFILMTLVQKKYFNVKLHINGAVTPLNNFWQRVGVITPREAVYISGDPKTSAPGPRFGAAPFDGDRALRKYTIDDTSTDMEAELQKLYQFLIGLAN